MKLNELKALFKAPTITSKEVDLISNHHDVILSSLYLIGIYIASLLPNFALKAITGRKLNGEKVREICADILAQIAFLCESCNYAMPDTADIGFFSESMPPEIRADATLTVFSMLAAISDISHIMYVERDGVAVWGEDELPEEFENDVLELLADIQNLGNKFGFTLAQVCYDANVDLDFTEQYT